MKASYEFPLDDVADDELIIELERRGYEVIAPEYPPSTAARITSLAELKRSRFKVIDGGEPSWNKA